MWLITPSWLSGSWRSFLCSSSVYSCHLFWISSASVRSIPFLSFIVPIFAWNPVYHFELISKQIVQMLFSFYRWENKLQFSSVTQSCLTLFTPWTAACQTSLSITNSQSLLKLISITLVMPSNHLILCRPPLLPPSLFPSIRVFSNESVLHINQVAKVLEFQLQHRSFQWIFRTDFL